MKKFKPDGSRKQLFKNWLGAAKNVSDKFSKIMISVASMIVKLRVRETTKEICGHQLTEDKKISCLSLFILYTKGLLYVIRYYQSCLLFVAKGLYV